MFALLPLKPRTRAKQRLHALFDDSQRAALVEAMARDVLAALLQVPALTASVAVLGSDAFAARLAEEYGVDFLSEPGTGGLNGAIDFARALPGVMSQSELLIVHADLPLADADSIGKLLAAHARCPTGGQISLVPDRHGQGTNCLAMTPVDAVPMLFGTGSRQRFQTAARDCKLRCQVLEMSAMQLDIDEPQDVMELLARVEAQPAAEALNSTSLLRTGSMAHSVEQYQRREHAGEGVNS